MHFFLNYGGPGGHWTSEDSRLTSQLDRSCRQTYGMPNRKVQYVVKGITVTVYTYGIHRALSLDLPKRASSESIDAFKKAKKVGEQICTTEYTFLGNNCVTAVANVLNTLDSRITPRDMVLPWNLDKNIKKYGKYYPEKTVAGDFIAKYTEIANREFFSFVRKRHWTEKTINSNQDIIDHAYGKTSGTGERTKSTLIELGWVKEDTNHVLRPTNKAPHEFKVGLEEFNLQHEKMLNLKRLYKTEAGFFSRNARDFFKDNPDYDTALNRIRQQAIKNPNGASSKVLQTIRNTTIRG
ncbi:hypothetical protein [Legionella waltersii]|uniref:DUF4105 domain-containing protein n=1 Tax=Legionella waltersii TaxID=66969 RepID=A0A0W1A1U8_9GAMM|nr:hypothetical protein [Legionella waltersii]KTD75306.1 hypothetical protein Lwal_3347 [Legionella waltersii]SNV07059.1 Uncharacterised protein [Legionella waltersii]